MTGTGLHTFACHIHLVLPKPLTVVQRIPLQMWAGLEDESGGCSSHTAGEGKAPTRPHVLRRQLPQPDDLLCSFSMAPRPWAALPTTQHGATGRKQRKAENTKAEPC